MSAYVIGPVLDRLALSIIDAGGVTLRDVDAGEEPFLYSSGNKGPGFVNIKGQVSNRALLKALVAQLAWRLVEAVPDLDFIAANVTGGVPPGLRLSDHVSDLLGVDIPMVYIRGSRKSGGLKEHITGLQIDEAKNHQRLQPGSQGVVVEELVNYATTTTNSCTLLRENFYSVKYGACIVSYDTKPCNGLLTEHGMQLIRLMTVQQILDVGLRAGRFTEKGLRQYQDFLADPPGWMRLHNLTREEKGGT